MAAAAKANLCFSVIYNQRDPEVTLNVAAHNFQPLLKQCACRNSLCSPQRSSKHVHELILDRDGAAVPVLSVV